MKLRFKVQRYQTEAVEAVADCFAGQPHGNGGTGDGGDGGNGDGGNAGIVLSPAELLENVRAVQRARGLPLSSALVQSPAATAPDTPNLDIEMETGTGKTYVYIKTIMELNKRYGWSKFLVVVPSVAIREGVRKSFEVTAEHIQLAYGSKPQSFCYTSSRLHEIDRFSSDAGVQVMIINVQAFNATGRDSRRIYDVLDDFQSRRPVDVISASRPVVIIDEPQRIGTARSLGALSLFSPLMVLRYSATHRVEHNKVHRLDALDAYEQKLVKRIAVRGITVRGLAGSAAYLYLDAIETEAGAGPRARLELEVRTASGIGRQVRRLGRGADLYHVSGGIEAYKGLVVTDIDAGRNVIEFGDGRVVTAGQVTADVTEETRRRIQIREVIRAHLERERELFPRGIKVLSLFFIDQVARYRDYNREDTRGEYARVFAEEYGEQAGDLLGRLPPGESGYRRYLEAIGVESTHRGYFSVDKKTGRDIDGDTKVAGEDRGQSADADAYDLILRDKERLLSLEEEVRFIFSHSALREGWDNPNVFVLGMLKKSDSGISRRQEIGRGLRLCVDSGGRRVDDPLTVHEINELTVVTDESYTAFAAGLQREMRRETSQRENGGREISAPPGTCQDRDRPGRDRPHRGRPDYPLPADGRGPRRSRLQEENAGGAATADPVAFDSGDLIDRCAAALDNRLKVGTLRYFVERGRPRAARLPGGGPAPAAAFAAASMISRAATVHAATKSAPPQVAYDLVGELAKRTCLTRRTIASILARIAPATFAQYRENPSEFIAGSARLIADQMTKLSGGPQGGA